jgi:hypothetical protein
VYLAVVDNFYFVAGLPEYENPECIKETSWGSKGIRDVLIHHTTEDGTNPVAQVMQAKVELDKKKLAAGDKMSDEEYQKQLSAIKSGDIYGNGQKIQTMTVIIKPMDTANYNNMVQALDEMQICSIGKYVIDKINEDDEKLLTLKGIKFAVD